MKHCGTQKLETDRLILRRYISEDAISMYKNWACDEDVTKYLMWQPHLSPEVSRSVTDEWVRQYANENFYHWAIVLKDNGNEPIGDIAVVNMNEKVSMAHIGYCLGKKWWHQGIMSEALKAVTDFLFDVADFNRIESRHALTIRTQAKSCKNAA